MAGSGRFLVRSGRGGDTVTPMRTPNRPVLLVALLVCVVWAAPAAADPDERITENISALSDAEIERRIAFIESKLDEQEFHAKWWQRGWTGFYATGVVVSSVQAGTTNSADGQADFIASAIKGVGGVARMTLAPHPGRMGAGDIRSMASATRADKERKLAAAESRLLAIAKRSEQRWSWKAHGFNVALNTVSAGIVWAFADKEAAGRNLGLGIGFGTANILSAPWKGDDYLEEYQTQFSGRASAGWNLAVRPTAGGAKIELQF